MWHPECDMWHNYKYSLLSIDKNENKNCSAYPKDHYINISISHITCERWNVTSDMWHNYKYSLLSLHMKTKVVLHVPRINISMSQTQTQSQPHWFPAFVMLTFLYKRHKTVLDDRDTQRRPFNVVLNLEETQFLAFFTLRPRDDLMVTCLSVSLELPRLAPTVRLWPVFHLEDESAHHLITPSVLSLSLSRGGPTRRDWSHFNFTSNEHLYSRQHSRNFNRK